jgi:hypothetical protein
MTRKSIFALFVAILVLVSIGLWAQTRRDPTAVTSAPQVLSGENVGVRVTGSDRNGKVTATLVVKINGQWVNVASSTTLQPASK